MSFWPGFSIPFGGAAGQGGQPPSLPVPAAPGAPTLTPGQERLSVSWTAVANAQQYDLQYASDAAFTTDLATVLGLSVTTHVLSLTHTKTWWVRIRAKNSSGTSAYGTSANATPLQLTAPTFNSFTNVTDTTITANWTSTSPNATSYTVEVGSSTGLSDVAVLSNLQTPIVAALSNLTPGEDYFFRARAVGLGDGVEDTERVQSTNAPQSGDITINISRSTTSGHAPLGVFFDASITTSTHTTDHFREMDFDWDFGDPSAGSWAFGNQSTATVTNKNKAIGPQTAHVYETASNYTVTLTVRAVKSDDTVISAVKTVDITVTSANAAYPGQQTICISTSGNFSGAPAGALQVQTSTWTTVETHLETANRRILFRAGEQWTSTKHTRPASGVHIGKYGTGANPVIVGGSTAGNDVFSFNGGDNRVVDITLRGQSGPPTYPQNGSNNCLRPNDITGFLALRCTIEKFKGYGVNATEDLQNSQKLKNAFFHDCVIRENRQYGLFIAATDSSWQGNEIHSVNVEHLHRITMLQRGVVAHSTYYDGRTGKHMLGVRGPLFPAPGAPGLAWGEGEYSEDFVICDNVFIVTGEQGSTPPVLVTQVQASSDNDDMRHRRWLYHRNFVYGNTHTTIGNGPQVGFICHGEKGSVQSNILDTTNFRFTRAISLNSSGAAPTPTDAHINNNTIYAATTKEGTPDGFWNNGLNTELRGNIVYFPAGGNVYDDDQPLTSTTVNNSTSATTNPSFVGPVGTSNPDGYKPGGGSYAQAGGGDLKDTFCWRDYGGSLRPATGQDMGAWEA